MQGGHTVLPAGARSGFEFRTAASGHGVDPERGDSPTPPSPCSLTPRRRHRPESSPTPTHRGNVRLRHLGNSSVRCDVQYVKRPLWRSGRVAEEGASDPVLRVGDRASVRRGYLGSSILPGAMRTRYASPSSASPLRHPGRWLAGDGATPSESTRIARRTPLAPIRDASGYQTRAPLRVCGPGGAGSPAPVHRTMKSKESSNLRTDDSTAPALDAYPAGKNHDDLLLCGPENDTQWLMSDTHVDLMEVR